MPSPDKTGTRPFAAFEWRLAGRYLRTRRREGFVSVIAGFSFLGIMLGVATLIVVLSVMNGFRKELLEKIVGINGHIFYFGTKYSEPMGATVTGPDGQEHTVHMGSYGIGPSRLVAAVIEASHDDNGIVWPESVAPFDVALLNLKAGDGGTDAACENLYRELTAAGRDVLYDDRDERPGAKFATADLIGVPWQLVVGPKGLADGKVELKRRKTAERETLPIGDVAARLAS